MLITHDAEDVAACADTVIRLANGRVIDGDPMAASGMAASATAGRRHLRSAAHPS